MGKIKFSDKQLKIIRAPFDHTLEVNEGTPRSGKTTAGHFRYAEFLTMTPDGNHLVTAYNQEQAFRLFIDGDGTGLMHIFSGLSEIRHDEHGDHLLVHTPNGDKRVYYKGGAKSNSVGAITGMSLGSVVFCEINLLHMDMIQECFRRTFAAKMRYHLADLNPPAPNDPVISDVFDVQNTRWTHWDVNDNPILTEERKQELHDTLIKNPYLYHRDWLGERVLPEGVIYGMFDMHENVKETLIGDPVEMFFTGDAGQGDATTIACWIVAQVPNENGRGFMTYLNRVANFYHSGNETGQVKAMSTYAREIKVFVDWCHKTFNLFYNNVFIDPAARSLREELRLVGIETYKADNNAHDIKGSAKGLEVGIERMQSLISERRFLLVNPPDSKYDHYHFIKEIGLYVRDDNGKPVDKNNHAMDEARYACNYFYRHYVGI
ncbi:PBSX family phage terminase large subunit [Sporolactobacillus laevolacticus]|uniref:Terminase n=1 Tax=Sporolactobacillus laevolacticus DSM 442 TaxID=1395513 RepID=V6IWW7_9BACL|nr:PBSX family phage terminase large subunit [Sporolactobacillus laevolacticus]EST11106.1 terminase [Sporolactobacillus laevolacticus DSM 442]